MALHQVISPHHKDLQEQEIIQMLYHLQATLTLKMICAEILLKDMDGEIQDIFKYSLSKEC